MAETVIHRAAKQIIQENRSLILPEYASLHYGKRPLHKNEIYLTKSILWSPAHKDLRAEVQKLFIPVQKFTADQVDVEVWMDGLRPDIVCRKKERSLLVEIKVTHDVDEAKRRKIVEKGLACVEIDLSGVPRDIDLPTLKQIVTGIDDGTARKPAPRHWVLNPKGDSRAVTLHHRHREILAKRINAAARTLDVRHSRIEKEVAEIVKGCPIHRYKGYCQAPMNDCIDCEHHIAYFGSGDEKLHAKLAAGAKSDIVYCACTSEKAQLYWQNERRNRERNPHSDWKLREAWEVGRRLGQKLNREQKERSKGKAESLRRRNR